MYFYNRRAFVDQSFNLGSCFRAETKIASELEQEKLQVKERSTATAFNKFTIKSCARRFASSATGFKATAFNEKLKAEVNESNSAS